MCGSLIERSLDGMRTSTQSPFSITNYPAVKSNFSILLCINHENCLASKLRHTSTRKRSLFGVTMIGLGLLLKSSVAFAAEVVIPPFVVEGRLLTQGFRPHGIQPKITNFNYRDYRTDANFVFIYSNGWWQLEARHASRSPGITNIYNCMKIPDVTRTYTLFEGITNAGINSASACPTELPPTGRPELLVPWLSFCPKPQLPLIDDKRMRRLINLPDCRPEIFNAPQNEGFFAIKHLTPGKAFLSELLITNNGYSVDLTVLAGGVVGGEIFRYSPPFENGFTELHYQVLASTNFNGVEFPLRTVSKRFYPNWEKKDRIELYLSLQSELTVTRISFAKEDIARGIASPTELYANDFRPPNLPKEKSADYIVRDDQWKPVSDPEIKRRAKIVRINSDRYLRESD